jgi:nicotinamidase/pyrazinamidase
MRKILIVIDMQNDFIDGSLANKAAEAIVPGIAKAIKDYSEVVFTRDTHDENYLSTAEGKKLPIEHCVRGTHGWEIRKELLDTAPVRAIIDKPTFGWLGWDLGLKPEDELTLVGTCTDICVVSNALILKAKYPESKISVIESLCAGLTEERHKAAIETMRSCQIDIL